MTARPTDTERAPDPAAEGDDGTGRDDAPAGPAPSESPAPSAAPSGSATPSGPADAAETVEAVVRREMAKALGGRRGMIEAAIPTILFTVVWIASHDLRWALGVSVSAALIALVIRVAQRSTVQFAVNALVGIGIGCLFVYLAARRNADADGNTLAMAYFLPGLLYNAGYAVVLGVGNLFRWPLLGLLVGSVTGDPTGWRQDRQLVALCQKLTWLLVLPCVLRVLVQGPIWVAGDQGWISGSVAVGILGVLKIVMGWPLQLAALSAIVWVLSRNHTPIVADDDRG